VRRLQRVTRNEEVLVEAHVRAAFVPDRAPSQSRYASPLKRTMTSSRRAIAIEPYTAREGEGSNSTPLPLRCKSP
jgi:hypothetical protein